MLKFEYTSIEDLKHAKDSLALEFLSITPATDYLKKLMPGIVNAFSNSNTSSDLPVLIPLNKDQSKLMKVLGEIPFTEIGQLKAYTPEGMGKKYLEYLHVLLPVTEKFKNLQNEIMQPYTLFLAQLVSDKLASVSTDNNKITYDKIEKDSEEIYKAFSKMYVKDSYKAETIVKNVVDRNNDFIPVFNQLNTCIANMQTIDRELIKRQVKQCVDYLNIIQDNLSKEQMNKTTREVAQRLSNGAYIVAKELEMMATTYYRVLALNGSIENTIKHILSVYD